MQGSMRWRLGLISCLSGLLCSWVIHPSFFFPRGSRNFHERRILYAHLRPLQGAPPTTTVRDFMALWSAAAGVGLLLLRSSIVKIYIERCDSFSSLPLDNILSRIYDLWFMISAFSFNFRDRGWEMIRNFDRAWNSPLLPNPQNPGASTTASKPWTQGFPQHTSPFVHLEWSLRTRSRARKSCCMFTE